MCWFALVRKMWGLLAISHAPITANDNLSNKKYVCLSLLAKIADVLRPVDARFIILGIYDHFFLSRDIIPLRKLDDC